MQKVKKSHHTLIHNDKKESPALISMLADVLLQGRRCGPSGSPVTFETQFGWVLAGRTSSHLSSHLSIISHHVSVTVTSGDDILRSFWEIEENPRKQSSLYPEERSVVEHFNKNHTRTESRVRNVAKSTAIVL